MADARSLLLVIIVSVCLLVILVITYASAIEKPGSDPTRPSDSIKTEEDTIQVDELGGNQSTGEKPDLDPLKIDNSIYKVKVTFDSMHIYSIHEENHGYIAVPLHFGTDTDHDGGEFRLNAYIQGKVDPLLFPLPHVHEGGITFGSSHTRTVEIPKTMPLSIMTVGYEKDDCEYDLPVNMQERIVKDFVSIPFSSLNPLPQYPHLRTIQSELNNNINLHCEPDDEKNDLLGFINKVYQPVSYGAGTHTVRSIGVPNAPDFELTYHIEVTPPINTIKK